MIFGRSKTKVPIIICSLTLVFELSWKQSNTKQMFCSKTLVINKILISALSAVLLVNKSNKCINKPNAAAFANYRLHSIYIVSHQECVIYRFLIKIAISDKTIMCLQKLHFFFAALLTDPGHAASTILHIHAVSLQSCQHDQWEPKYYLRTGHNNQSVFACDSS